MCLGFFRRLKEAKARKKAALAAENSARTLVKEEEPAPVEPAAPAKEPEKVTVAVPQKVPAAAPVEKSEAKKPVKREIVRVDNGNVLVKVRYNRSFTAKLIQSDDRTKGYYSEIKAELLQYKVKERISWRHETFKKGRKLLAKLSMRGKTLSLYLALDPKSYENTRYKVDDVSGTAKYADTPLLYKLKNDRRVKYSRDLISALMTQEGLEAGEKRVEDYSAIYPYEEIEPLIERGLVKLLKWKERDAGAEEGVVEVTRSQEELMAEKGYATKEESITVAEAEEQISDEQVETYVHESERYSDKTKKDIVNIDTLGKYFKSGENVTVEEIRKRVPAVNARTTYIKVLARGTLNKALNVEADDFSPAAIKMIVLMGGTVTRTKK